MAMLFVFRPRLSPFRHRVSSLGLALMTTVAVAYTTPWDNYLIRQGVWFYGEGAVAVRFGAAPLGEYLFFAFQPVLVGLWLYQVGFDPTYREGDFARGARILGAAVWLLLAAGGGLLVLRGGGWYYLGAILVWACPILALQWAVGANYLLRSPKPWITAVTIPTLFLWAIDRIAIGIGIWTISTDHSTGVKLLGLPVEEAVFFLVTNLLVVTGLVLFEWVMDYWLESGLTRLPSRTRTEADERSIQGVRK